ncbi:MAG: MFS transporter [Candidatus Limnocylindrales bacterium]
MNSNHSGREARVAAAGGAAAEGASAPRRSRRHDPNYKWVALSNTTLGVLMSAIDGSIVIISLPAIFTGIKLNPLDPGSTSYLLWIMMGYLLVTAVLVVAFGRLGDMFGRVRMYNAGFVIFTVGSLLLALTPFTGPAGAIWIIGMRFVQGIGGAFLFANSQAILTDAFPPEQRGLAFGVNGISFLAGQFVGLVVGGVLAAINWRLVFFVSVPVGLVGTIWAYMRLEELGTVTHAKIDWPGNLTFGIGLTALLIGITYGIQPYGGQTMGWTNPFVLSMIGGGLLLLALFVWVERRVAEPLFDLALFRIRAFTAGNLAGFLSALGRGGLSFMLVIWLQGVWLPLHGYSFADTPLWAGIYMLPLTLGSLVFGPLSGYLSDRFGARPFATGGMLIAAASFFGLILLPVDFPYWQFGGLLLVSGIGGGLFFSPNMAGIMNSVPARQRGAAAGMRATFQNSATVVSIGVFFSLMIAGLSASLPGSLYDGLTAHAVPAADASQISHLPPVASLFAALLGYNPMAALLPPQVLHSLPASQAAILTSKEFFPQLIAAPLQAGLAIVFAAAGLMALVAAWASWLRGGLYIHDESAAVSSPSRVRPSSPAKTPATENAGAVVRIRDRADGPPDATSRREPGSEVETSDP